MNSRARTIIGCPAVIFIAAVCTRLGAAAYTFRNSFGPDVLFVQNEPSHIAAALASGLGFSSPYAGIPPAPTAQQPPLYPLIVAVIFRIFGVFTIQSAWAVVGLNILAGGITAVLIYRLGRVHFGNTVGLVAAWLWVLPWMYESRAFSVSCSSSYLAALGFTALLLLFSNGMKSDWSWIALGSFCGALVLLQTTLLAVFVVYGICLVLAKQRKSHILMAALALLVVLVPWTVRNYTVFGRLIPIRDNFGLELWLGNRPGMQGTVDYSGDFPDHDPTGYSRMGEMKFMDTKFRDATQYILRNPAAFVSRFFRRMVEFWYFPYPIEWIVLSVLGWAGALSVWKTHQNSWLFIVPLFTYPLVFFITHLFANYRHPIDPIIVLLAAYAIVDRGRRYHEHVKSNVATEPCLSGRTAPPSPKLLRGPYRRAAIARPS
jgi:4-amino-4-deoxy-L-arabinose transferase-like glycosyltransferase